MDNSKIENPERKDILKQLEVLENDDEFWNHQHQGFAGFVKGEELRVRTAPVNWEEIVSFGDKFLILPLLPILDAAHSSSVIVISQNQVRLFSATEFEIREIEAANSIPRSLIDVVGSEVEEQSLQFHSNQGRSGSPMYHGQGKGKDDAAHELERFCREIDSGLESHVDRQDPSGLIVVGDVSLTPIFCGVTDRKIAGIVNGNYDDADANQIFEAVSSVVKKTAQDVSAEAIERYQSAAARNQSSSDSYEIGSEAQVGRINELLIRGDFDPLRPDRKILSTEQRRESRFYRDAAQRWHGPNHTVRILSNEVRRFTRDFSVLSNSENREILSRRCLPERYYLKTAIDF